MVRTKYREFLSLEKSRSVLISSVIIAVLLALGVSINLTSMTSMSAEDSSPAILFFRNLTLSFPESRLQYLFSTIAIFCLVFMGRTIRRQDKVRNPGLIKAIAIFFAIMQMVAKAYRAKTDYAPSISFMWSSAIVVLRVFLLGISLAMVAYYLMVVISWALIGGKDEITVDIRKEKPNLPWKFSLSLKMILVIFLAWLPYYLVYWPGTANADTIVQILQYNHISTHINPLSAVTGPEYFITNHHPYLLTMIFGTFCKLGVAMGDIRIGFTIYIIIHMLFQAAVFTFCLQYLRRIGVRDRAVKITQYIIMFLPVFPLHAICMLKDNVYSAFVLLVLFCLVEIVRTKGEVLGQKKFLAFFFIVSLLMMMTKVYGKYVMIGLCVIMLFRYRRYWKQTLISTVVPVLIFQFLYMGLLMDALKVAPGGLQEALSVPFQQTTRYIKTYRDELTQEEYDAINDLIPVDKIVEVYEPERSDNVKELYDQQTTMSELLRYIKVWAQMGLKHPLVYIDATLNNIYDYFDIDKTDYLNYKMISNYIQSQPEIYPPEEYSWLYIEAPEFLESARYAVAQMTQLVERIPVIGWLMSMGLLPYLILFTAYMNKARKRRDEHLLLVLPFLSFCVCVLSPENGNARYVMPLIYMLPFLACKIINEQIVKYEVLGNGKGDADAEDNEIILEPEDVVVESAEESTGESTEEAAETTAEETSAESTAEEKTKED